MEAFYCVIYVRFNRATDEKIAVGLFASTPNWVGFKYSNEKLNVAKKLLPAALVDDLRYNLVTLEKSTEAYRQNPGLFSKDKKYSAAEWTYLSHNSNGLMAIAEPKETHAPLTEEVFHMLFQNYVFDLFDGIPKPKEHSPRNKVKEVLKAPAFKKIDTHYNVQPAVIPTILVPHELDFIGKNGAFLVGDTVNVHSGPARFESKVFAYSRIVGGLKKLAAKHGLKSGTYFLYHDSPTDGTVIDLIKRIGKDKSFEFTLQHIDHMPEVASTIEAHNYTTFSSWLIEQGLVAQPQ